MVALSRSQSMNFSAHTSLLPSCCLLVMVQPALCHHLVSSTNHYHLFYLQPTRHPLRTFTALPVLFLVCTSSTFPCLAYTMPPLNKVGTQFHFYYLMVLSSHPRYYRITLLLAIEYAWNTYPSTIVPPWAPCSSVTSTNQGLGYPMGPLNEG